MSNTTDTVGDAADCRRSMRCWVTYGKRRLPLDSCTRESASRSATIRSKQAMLSQTTSQREHRRDALVPLPVPTVVSTKATAVSISLEYIGNVHFHCTVTVSPGMADLSGHTACHG